MTSTRSDPTRFLGYGRQEVTAEDVQEVTEVLMGDYLTQGPAVDRFESALAAFVGTTEAVVVNSGTAALHLLYLSLGLGPGDAVVIPAITFAATANAALYCGATPVFADIDRGDIGLSVASAERAAAAAAAAGLKVKAIAAVHYAGLPANLNALSELAARIGATLIHDACHALGAEVRRSEATPWKRLGAEKGAHCAWSFHPVKHITTGEGGAITTDDPSLGAVCRELRSHGIVRDARQFRHRSSSDVQRMPWYHEMQSLGFNYRMPDINAALGLSQLRRASQFVTRRRAIAARYRKNLAGISSVELPPGDSPVIRHSYHLFPVRLSFDRIGIDRGTFMFGLRERGVGTQVHYIPVPWHPFYRENHQRWLADAFPEAERFYEETLSIPMFPAMTDEDVDYVSDCILQLLPR